ncbi:MAG: putative RNA methyltransferase [Erysipelotrichaceae bacterium]|jgi:23S rRNA (guanine745-N1)-methyltransferase
MLRCPKCQERLIKDGKRYLCKNNHSYDIARAGYVNLILANQKSSANAGDNIDSLNARDRFLNKEYYKPLADCLSSLVNKYLKDGNSFLDAGCGTGYYLQQLINSCNKDISFLATDISKKGVMMTSRKCQSATCFVGNVFHLPFEAANLDGAMSVFCPYSSEEFARVIKQDGYLFAVTPGKQHLFELKEIVYENPYLNKEEGYKLEQFLLVEQFNVTYIMNLKSNDDILSLWRMMPYYHTSSKEDSSKLEGVEKIDCTADFLVSVYKRY